MGRAPSSAGSSEDPSAILEETGIPYRNIRLIAENIDSLIAVADDLDAVLAAKTAAEAAEADAEIHQATAANNAVFALNARDAAIAARDLAVASSDAATTAKNAAELAETNAETAAAAAAASAASTASGTYVPVHSNIAPDGIDNWVSTKAHYLRVGNIVTVTIRGTADVQAGACAMGLSLPIASDITSVDVIGLAKLSAVGTDMQIRISGNTGSNLAQLTFTAPATENVTFYMMFQYEII
jgi:hypothetical protein